MITDTLFTIIRFFKKPLFFSIFIANVHISIVLFIISLMYPDALNLTTWLYDDVYVLENALRYYVDFRPGYPPLGKIPIHLIYMYSNGENLAILIYNIITFNISTVVFYYLVKNLAKNDALVLKAVIFYVCNPAVIVALLQPHGDFLVLSFTLMSLLFILRKRLYMAVVSTAFGFLTKIYTVLLLVPMMIIASNRVRVLIITVFVAVTWLVSLPFLLGDPLMYISTFVHHLYRGPSESFIAILDGYYGHTGFTHPLFDAAIYYYQFTKIYQPSPDQHFYYAWRNPMLKYIALLVLLIGFIPLCLYFFKRRLEGGQMSIEKSFNLLILSLFTCLALSPSQNILTHLPAYTFACILLVSSLNKKSTAIIVLYMIVNGIHATCWSIFYSHVEFVLYAVSNIRVIIIASIFFLITNYIVVSKH